MCRVERVRIARTHTAGRKAEEAMVVVGEEGVVMEVGVMVVVELAAVAMAAVAMEVEAMAVEVVSVEALAAAMAVEAEAAAREAEEREGVEPEEELVVGMVVAARAVAMGLACMAVMGDTGRGGLTMLS